MMNKRPHGFSLLEVMIAVAILALAFLTLIDFQGESLFRMGRAEKFTQATFLAGEKMGEVLLEIEKEQIQQQVFPEDKTEEGTFDKPFEAFRWEWKVRKVAIPAPSFEEGGAQVAMLKMVTEQIKDMVREIKLTISWEELGKGRKVELVTHITKM